METVEGKHDLEGFKVCHDDYIGHLEYYVNKLAEKKVNIEFCDAESLDVGDKVIFHRETIMKKIEDRYNFTELDNYFNVQMLKIDGLKGTLKSTSEIGDQIE